LVDLPYRRGKRALDLSCADKGLTGMIECSPGYCLTAAGACEAFSTSSSPARIGKDS